MYPDRRFAWEDEAALRAFVNRRGFAQISVAVGEIVECAHAPLVEATDGSFRFHLARGNALCKFLDGRPVLATVLGDEGYISPDWYGSDDQVPTWNYTLVEIHGHVRRLDTSEAIEQLEGLSAVQEAQLLPKAPWTSAKMSAGLLQTMARGITGFAIDAPELRGLVKLGQNKSAGERGGAIAALRAIGKHALADAMENPFSPRKREQPAAKRWEGEGDTSSVSHPHPSHAFGAGPFPLAAGEGV